MNAPIEFQVIKGRDGKPAFVVVPFEDFKRLQQRKRSASSVPHEVVTLAFDHQWTAMAAWREHLRLTQAEIAKRMGITQSAYAQMERSRKPRARTLERAARAMGVNAEQLNW